VEIVTSEWKYFDSDEYNFCRILNIKEQRRLGISRGRTAVPQAPTLAVRIKADTKGLTNESAVRADLWSFGPAFEDKSKIRRAEPFPVDKGSKLTKLRGSAVITCKYNVVQFGQVEPDGYRYADLKIFITRGARVCCRKNHIAFRLSVVEKIDDETFKRNTLIPITRTSRVSISEKAMCPRDSSRKSKPSLSESGNFLTTAVTNGRKRSRSDCSEISCSSSILPDPATSLKKIAKVSCGTNYPLSYSNISQEACAQLSWNQAIRAISMERAAIQKIIQSGMKSPVRSIATLNPQSFLPFLQSTPTLGSTYFDLAAQLSHSTNAIYGSGQIGNGKLPWIRDSIVYPSCKSIYNLNQQ